MVIMSMVGRRKQANRSNSFVEFQTSRKPCLKKQNKIHSIKRITKVVFYHLHICTQMHTHPIHASAPAHTYKGSIQKIHIYQSYNTVAISRTWGVALKVSDSTLRKATGACSGISGASHSAKPNSSPDLGGLQTQDLYLPQSVWPLQIC